VLAIVGAVVVAFVMGMVGLVFLGGTSEEEDQAEVRADADPADGPVVTTPSGAALTLPDGWVGTSIEEGVDGIGAALFPDDPRMAEDLDRRARVLPRAISIFGMDATDVDKPFQDNVNALNDLTAPASYSLDEIGRAEATSIGAFGGRVTERERVDLGAFDAVRIQYQGRGAPFEGVAYVVKTGADTWVLTYTFADLTAANLELADGSAGSFSAP
jgi:hypothetical protein